MCSPPGIPSISIPIFPIAGEIWAVRRPRSSGFIRKGRPKEGGGQMADFLMSFPELNLSVKVEPLANNQNLYDWFLENLPLKGIQSHAVVSGKIIYIMNLRMKKACPVRYRHLAVEDLSEGKDGRIFIFITAGRGGC